MHRIDSSNAGPKGEWVAGSATVSPTAGTAAWFNGIQDEIAGVIESQNIPLNKADNTQLLKALKNLISSVVPVGASMFWCGENPPDGWFEEDGATFNAAMFPALAAALGGNTLADLRGEFVRGWDHGRGVDVDWDDLPSDIPRPIGSLERSSEVPINYGPNGTLPIADVVGGDHYTTLQRDYREVTGAWSSATISIGYKGIRPRNVAKMSIIKHD